MGECHVSGPFSGAQLRGYFTKVRLNTIRGETNGRAKPDVRTLVDTKQGADRTPPICALTGVSFRARCGPPDTSGLLMARNSTRERRIEWSQRQRGNRVSFLSRRIDYANNVDAFGVLSAGVNWGLLSSAVRRWKCHRLGRGSSSG